MFSFLALSSCSILAVLAPAAQQTKFGAAVAMSDVNGDGFDDVIVGEPLYEGAFDGEGRVLVYPGSAAGPAASPTWTRRGFQAHAHFGAAVAGVGDVNGDGYEDVLVGAPEFDAPRSSKLDGPGAAQSLTHLRNAGAIALFLGSPGGLSSTPSLAKFGPEPDEFFGRTLARAGDVNGDGFDDFIVGAIGTGPDLGGAFVFHGSPSGPNPNPNWIVLGLEPGARFGWCVSGGGDINGDGFDDVVVGAPDAGGGQTGTAKAYFGSADGLPPFSQWSLGFPAGGADGTDYDGNSDWGAVVCVAGDQNGDGFSEVLVSNPTYNAAGGHGSGPLLDVGFVRLFRGSAGTLQATTVQWGPFDGSYLVGRALAAVGDTNGDDLADVVLGSTCIPGAATGFWGTATALIPPPVPERFLSSAGDVDGDGYDDVLIGGPSPTGVSKVQLHRGSSSGVSATATWTILAP